MHTCVELELLARYASVKHLALVCQSAGQVESSAGRRGGCNDRICTPELLQLLDRILLRRVDVDMGTQAQCPLFLRRGRRDGDGVVSHGAAVLHGQMPKSSVKP